MLISFVVLFIVFLCHWCFFVSFPKWNQNFIEFWACSTTTIRMEGFTRASRRWWISWSDSGELLFLTLRSQRYIELELVCFYDFWFLHARGSCFNLYDLALMKFPFCFVFWFCRSLCCTLMSGSICVGKQD